MAEHPGEEQPGSTEAENAVNAVNTPGDAPSSQHFRFSRFVDRTREIFAWMSGRAAPVGDVEVPAQGNAPAAQAPPRPGNSAKGSQPTNDGAIPSEEEADSVHHPTAAVDGE